LLVTMRINFTLPFFQYPLWSFQFATGFSFHISYSTNIPVHSFFNEFKVDQVLREKLSGKAPGNLFPANKHRREVKSWFSAYFF